MQKSEQTLQFPSMYFQFWVADSLAEQGLAENSNEVKSLYNHFLADHPDAQLKAYHLVRANVK